MLREVVRQEGVLKMWKGNSAAVVRVIPYLATQVRASVHGACQLSCPQLTVHHLLLSTLLPLDRIGVMGV